MTTKTTIKTDSIFIPETLKSEIAAACENYVFLSGQILFVQSDAIGNILSYNPSFRRLFGIPSDFTQLNFFDYFTSENNTLSGGYGDEPGLPMTFTSSRTDGNFLFYIYEESGTYYLFGQRLDIHDVTLFSKLADLSTEMGRLVQDLKRSQREITHKNNELNNTVQELNKALDEIKALKESEKENIYKATIMGTQHILNNLLNQLTLIDIEIAKTPDFDREVATKFNLIRTHAKELVERLCSVDQIDVEEIKKAVLPK